MNAEDTTTPRIVVPPAAPKTELLAAPAPVPADAGTLVVPGQARAPIAVGADAETALVQDLYAQYAVLGKIGDGGMGIVYLARDRKLGRHVAIKRLKPGAQGNVSLRRRFLHEARAAAALGHPHIVHVYSLGADAEGAFIVMEYVAGDLPPAPGAPGSPPPPQTLEQYVSRHGAFAVGAASQLLVKLGRAVAYAHACGVIHRDLKPSNILMDRTGEPKVVDFGLARLMRAEDGKLTAPGEKLLSLGYGAPEQESDASVSDERADVYGLGALLYFVLTAQNPRYFREEDVPISVRPVLTRAIARDREQRWPTVAAFTEALLALQSQTRIETPTVKTTWRCKWCDTFNPLTTRFCAECGWDGGEQCVECGADAHVGVPFCRACGANARDYEQVTATLARARASLAAGAYEAAAALASKTLSLEPTGPVGRRLLEELRDLRVTSEQKRARRDQLRDLVDVEFRAENYERAARFIDEYRSLAVDPRAFGAQCGKLPELMARRDLARVRRAFREGDWEQGARLLTTLDTEAGRAQPEHARLVRQLRGHRRARLAWRGAAAGLLAALAYVLLPPPLAHAFDGPWPRWARVACAPAVRLYRWPPASAVLARYAALWRVTLDRLPSAAAVASPSAAAVASPGGAATPEATPGGAAPPPPAPSAELARLDRLYREQLAELAAEYQRNMAAWPPDYRRALEVLRDRYQSLGDFDGWHAAGQELARFEAEGGIVPPAAADPDELRELKANYGALLEGYKVARLRKLTTATRRHINELSALLRELTRAGRMELAEGVNRELQRWRDDAEYRDAERRLAAYDAARPDGEAPPPIRADPNALAELSALRGDFEEEQRRIAEEHALRRDAWPARYVADLRAFMEGRQREGDFLGWEAANIELDRFERDGTLGATDDARGAGPLGDLRRRHAALLDSYDLTRARGLVKAHERYLGKLDGLVSHYTKSKNIEAATLVNSELRRVKAGPDLAEARRLLQKPALEASE